MKTWTATTTVDAGPEAVLDVLTDPDAVARWAPLPFDVDDLDTPRLDDRPPRPRLRPPGRPPRRLRRRGPRGRRRGASSLAAHGPVGLDVAYDLAATGGGSEVRASISVRPGKGITGRLLAEATNALLSAGALTHAISRLARRGGAAPPEPSTERTAMLTHTVHGRSRRPRARRRPRAAVTRHYGEGEAAVHALRGVIARGARRPVHRRHGPVGLRQVDAHAPARRPRPPDQRPREDRRRGHHRRWPTSSSPSCAAATSASSSSRSTCCRC